MTTIRDIKRIVKEAAAKGLCEAERRTWIGEQVEKMLGQPARRGRRPIPEQDLEQLATRASALAAFGETKSDRARSLNNGVYFILAGEKNKSPSAIQKAIKKYKDSHPEPTDDELAAALQPWLDSD